MDDVHDFHRICSPYQMLNDLRSDYDKLKNQWASPKVLENISISNECFL